MYAYMSTENHHSYPSSSEALAVKAITSISQCTVHAQEITTLAPTTDWLKASGSLKFAPSGAEMTKWWTSVNTRKQVHRRCILYPGGRISSSTQFADTDPLYQGFTSIVISFA